MAKKEKPQKSEKTVRDPYTGEEKPPIPDSEKSTQVIPEETHDRKGQHYLLNEECRMDAVAADENADDATDLVTSFTEDEDVEEDFAEWQAFGAAGREALEEKLDEHHSRSPEISGGDIDAAWELADQAGEETVGGSVPTTDQGQVDEIGKAAGLTYHDDEPLNSGEKLAHRDRYRWELNPASTLEENEDLLNEDEEIREREQRLMSDDD